MLIYIFLNLLILYLGNNSYNIYQNAVLLNILILTTNKLKNFQIQF